MTEFAMISISDAAIEHLLKAVAALEDDPRKHVRLSVLGKGCVGFKYDWKFEDHIDENDITIPLDENTNLIVGTKSQELLEGASIELVNVNAFTKEIKITNPNMGTCCGCGKSYA